ncbi:MAG: hypothetical protein LBH03_07510 [Holophagales bacterium]|jgi:hypothetical protein|nr:hypothetical protein [Holophagales bacterium]
MRSFSQFSLAGFMLLGLLSCSGGSKESPKIASSLVYTDPTDTERYRFVKGADSTSDKLVLELRGPASYRGRGVTFGLQADSSVNFVKLRESDAEFAQNGVFELGNAPQLFKSVMDGNTLRVSLAQKGTGNAQILSGVLARVAVQLQSGVVQGTNVSLRVLNDARVLPENGNSTSINVEIGKLTAQ